MYKDHGIGPIRLEYLPNIINLGFKQFKLGQTKGEPSNSFNLFSKFKYFQLTPPNQKVIITNLKIIMSILAHKYQLF